MIRTNEFSKEMIANMTSSPSLEKGHFFGTPFITEIEQYLLVLLYYT